MFEFNRLLLISCICIVGALILYFFYWNRFVAWILGQAIRILFWNQEGSSLWIEIGSIHFSLIAGRILLKDVRYHSSSQTIKIVTGQIQWRYWIRQPTSEEEINAVPGEQDARQSNRLWSCRVQLSFQGLEWFLYNRTAAYDSIIEQIEKSNRPASRSSSHRRLFNRFTRRDTASYSYPPSGLKSPIRVLAIVNKTLAWFRQQLPTLDPKDLLPIGIDIQTGAIILGNPSTPNLLVAEFQNALGTFGITPSRSRYDLYKQVLGLKFQNALIRLVQNEDYVDPMATLGALVHSRVKHHPTLQKPSFYQSYRPFIKLWRQFGLYRVITDYFVSRRAQRSTQHSISSSIFLKRSKKAVDEDTPIGIDFSTFEYAVERKILEAPSLELTYYVDVVGEIPSQPIVPRYAGDGIPDINNGDTPPEWGFDLIVYGGFLRYGPWADRQRAELQRAFFPPTYRDSEVTLPLKSGDKRMWTSLQMFIELRDTTTLSLPFREASKDWQWDGVVQVPQRPRKREAAFINLAVGDRSSINYILPMIVGPSGYEPTLEVHLDTIDISSSLNDIRLISSESLRIRCELPSPISWNAERTWSIAVFLRQPVLFLLRDHINMFTDLGKDWVSGPPTDYQKFIPMIYTFRLEMHHFEMNMYANDQNIVDKPLIKEENALIALSGPHLKTTTTIPSNVFRPESTSIPFTVVAPDVVASFFLPRWNTHALYIPSEGLDIFKAPFFGLNGSYRYFAAVGDEHIEQLRLDFDIRNAVYRAYGWSIRYFMVLRDNYLGSFTHFQTLAEYLDKRQRKLPTGDPITLKYRPGKANMLHSEISLRVQNAKILLPVTLVGAGNANKTFKPTELRATNHGEDNNYINMTVPEIQLHFRMHDYYMEMTLNLDTIVGSVPRINSEPVAMHEASGFSECFMIDGIDVTANRLFGPQPKTATYVCIWEVAFGSVKASMSAQEAALLAAAGNAFRLNFVDSVNAPAEEFLPTIDLDVTFYKITVRTIEIMWKTGHAALLVQILNGLKFDSNDLGAHQYRKVTSIRIPHISLKVLLTMSMERNTWLEAAEIDLDTYLDIYAAPIGYRTMIRNQLCFLEEQDKLTGRAKLMLNRLRQHNKVNIPSDRVSHRNAVYLPQPTLPSMAGTSSVTASSQQSSHISRPRPASWRFSTLANLSDSEGEEGVSEADRDARLARTRTSTPIPRPFEEDDSTSSSGDESDDADLTDGESTANDWSDIGDSSSSQGTSSLMSFYSPVSRHYVANWLHASKSWEEDPFTLTKQGASFMRRDLSLDKSIKVADSIFTLPEGVPKDENLTIFRLKCKRAAQFIFNPLILPAVASFEEDVKTIISSPEMCLDSFLVDSLSKKSSDLSSNCIIFDLSLPRMIIQAIQHVSITDNRPSSLNKAMKSASIPSNMDIITLLNFDLDGLRLAVISGEKSSAIKASIEQTTAIFDMSIDKRTLPSTLPNAKVFDFILSSLSVQLSQHRLVTSLGDTSIEIGHRGPELVTATSFALISTATLITQSITRVENHRVDQKRETVRKTLNASDQGAVIDPLSTIQPSYLVQSGVPRLLRTDMTFKFVYYLRNCIWNMTKVDYHKLRQQSSDTSLETFVSSVESRLASLDPDSCSITDLSPMKSLFFAPGDARLTRQKSNTQLIHLWSVYFTKATATILAPIGGSITKFIIQDFGISLQTKAFDLIQLNFTNASSASQSSLRSKSSKLVRRMLINISIGNLNLIVSPHLMHFSQHVLRVQRQFFSGVDDANASKNIRESTDKSSSYHVEIIGVIHHISIRAAAENLVLVMGINGAQTSTTMLFNSKHTSPSINHSTLFRELYLQARSPTDKAREDDQDILAALIFSSGAISTLSQAESSSRKNLKLVFSLDGLRLNVPRSALRLYHFVGQWRADYLPGIEATLKTLLAEYNAGPTKPVVSTSSRQSSPSPNVQIHGQLNHFEISLQVMHGTWLSWEVHKTIAYVQASSALPLSSSHTFGLQIASMVLNVSSKPDARDVAPSSRVKLVLPQISLTGHLNGDEVQTLILFDFIELKVKPSHWDTLLAVQQKFGQDFNDLVALIQKTRQEGSSHSKQIHIQKKVIQYGAHFKMRGFRIGLEGVPSTVLLECQDINGGFNNINEWRWNVGLSDLALSLGPRARGRHNPAFNRNQRSAFVIIDFKLGGTGAEKPRVKSLHLLVTKIHAVMQPSSIGEFGDFIDNLQAEMLERQEHRALELAAFKEKTQHILRTFDASLKDVQVEKSPWINDFVITVSIHSIGVAFPLTRDEDLELPHSKNETLTSVRAFLFTIKSIEFETHHGETGQAVMQRLSFQFVSRFRQSFPEDFAAEKHYTRNCLLYPEMKAQLRSSSSGSSRKIWIKGDVSGFILDIDSSIPNYIFALVDVYRTGKERVERLSTNVPRTPVTSIPIISEHAGPLIDKHHATMPTSNVFSQLVFHSGKVRLYSRSASTLFRTKIMNSSTFFELPDDQILALGAEVFNLPVVSVWGEYRATSASKKVLKGTENEPSTLMFNSMVFSSQNTLRPSLLPFVTELVNHIEMRLRKVSSRAPRPPPLSSIPSTASIPREDDSVDSVSSMQICFSLRIDKSKLELTCQPDVNVVAGLHWENGGFVISVSPGARKVSFFGSVGGLTVGLKHGFLSEDCVKVDARNLTFSVAFAKMESHLGNSFNSISVALDTEFLGGVRFSRLQDILCFKAVWLDRIPIFNSQTPIEPKTPYRPLDFRNIHLDSQSKTGFATIILVRIRKVALEIELGQSITKINLELHQSTFRTKLTDDVKEVFFHIGNVTIGAQGNLSGRASVSSCVFQTIRRSEDMLWVDNGRSRMLELRLTSGALTIVLDSDHQRLLHYRAEPLEVEIFDDWSKAQPNIEDESNPVQLSFTITCPEIVAVVTVSTIPKLLSYMNKFKANLDAQRQGAARESQTFRITRTPKPDNPLSAVAEAMLYSARSRFKEAESGLSYVIRQHISLRLDLLRLIVFPRTMRDSEIAQFIGRDVRARLDGIIGSDLTPAKRDLHLSFSSMIISKYTQVAHSTLVPLSSLEYHDDPNWLTTLFKNGTEAIVVGLPSMKMHMTSEEILKDATITLVYDFHSEFIRRAGMKAFEDIYITLNMSLYSWLTILRKNLTRELEQVRATEDWRTSVSNISTAVVASGSQRKKRIPDTLSLTDSPRSATLPSESSSMFSPASARPGWTEQSKSPTSGREKPLLVSALQFPAPKDPEVQEEPPFSQGLPKRSTTAYQPRNRHIERLTMRQLGEATPDVMHPFFMKKAGFNLEDSLPQYVNEYATVPLQEILEVLLKLYSQQLLTGTKKNLSPE